MRTSSILALTILAFGVVILAALVLKDGHWGDDPLLTTCEDAIKAKLKAPSSYKRVKTDGVAGSFWKIEYDAVNSFNAPLRGRGTCFGKPGGNADWFEDTSTSETDTMTAP